MLKTNKSGQNLYPFNGSNNYDKFVYEQDIKYQRIQEIQNGQPEEYPGELDILLTEKTELDELVALSHEAGITYITGNLYSRAKYWIGEYDKTAVK